MAWCPKCGERLDNTTVAGFGYCPEHGRQPAEFKRPINIVCPTCKGTGGGQYNDCPTCDGNGVI